MVTRSCIHSLVPAAISTLCAHREPKTGSGIVGITAIVVLVSSDLSGAEIHHRAIERAYHENEMKMTGGLVAICSVLRTPCAVRRTLRLRPENSL